MNSEEVWRLWRRVLREPDLAAAVIDGSVLDGPADWGLAEPQRQIIQHYALNPSGVTWAVEGYRFRLVRVTRYCVAEAAPLTARALVEAEYDLGRLAEDFVEYTGWLDRGPYVLGLTLNYLNYLVDVAFRRGAVRPQAVIDVARLEMAALRLAMKQACSELAQNAIGEEPIRWTGRASMVRVQHDVMPWLAEPAVHPLNAAPECERDVLLYLDDSVNDCRMVALSEAAATVVRLLASGVGIADVTATLGVDQAHPGLAAMLDTFVDWGVVAPASGASGDGSHTPSTAAQRTAVQSR